MRTRTHKMRWTVRWADRLAAACITVGGIGTILAVTGVFLFLVSVVVPIFRPGRAVSAGHGAREASAPICAGTDEYRVCGWSLGHDGSFRSFRLDNGDVLSTQALVPSDSLTGASNDVMSSSLALGRRDGSIRFFRIEWVTDYPPESALPPNVSLSRASH